VRSVSISASERQRFHPHTRAPRAHRISLAPRVRFPLPPAVPGKHLQRQSSTPTPRWPRRHRPAGGVRPCRRNCLLCGAPDAFHNSLLCRRRAATIRPCSSLRVRRQIRKPTRAAAGAACAAKTRGSDTAAQMSAAAPRRSAGRECRRLPGAIVVAANPGLALQRHWELPAVLWMASPCTISGAAGLVRVTYFPASGSK
jgi:hypothetical protein